MGLILFQRTRIYTPDQRKVCAHWETSPYPSSIHLWFRRFCDLMVPSARPNSTFDTRPSKFDKISSPGTPRTPPRLDNSSVLWETLPVMARPEGPPCVAEASSKR